jgi:hypothetical protein
VIAESDGIVQCTLKSETGTDYHYTNSTLFHESAKQLQHAEEKVLPAREYVSHTKRRHGLRSEDFRTEENVFALEGLARNEKGYLSRIRTFEPPGLIEAVFIRSDIPRKMDPTPPSFLREDLEAVRHIPMIEDYIQNPGMLKAKRAFTRAAINAADCRELESLWGTASGACMIWSLNIAKELTGSPSGLIIGDSGNHRAAWSSNGVH